MSNANSASPSGHSSDPNASPRVPAPSLLAPRSSLPSQPPTPWWRIAFGVYAWLPFTLLMLAALPVLLCLPTLKRRRALVRQLARVALRLAGMRLKVADMSCLPLPCVVVANHSSYLDGVVLAAVLPPEFGFVIKREMSSVPLAGTLLRRIGAEFVERRKHAGGMRDARRLLRAALGGQALAFFPEGTFSTTAGLLRFHTGAFAAAARANLPVVPIAIRGTRSCLPPGSHWPRPGIIEIQPLATLPAVAGGSAPPADRALLLRDSARAALLAALGEPDLAACIPG